MVPVRYEEHYAYSGSTEAANCFLMWDVMEAPTMEIEKIFIFNSLLHAF